VLITATAATSTQSSALIYKPLWATGLFLILDITAGSTLALDVYLQAYSPGAAAYVDWLTEVPTTELTGVSETGFVFTALGIVTGGHYNVEDRVVMLPPQFRVQVTHDNANEATYVLYGQWIK
jgi:hypothetical protein